MINKDDYYIEIQVVGESLKVCKLKNKKIINYFTFDLIDYNFESDFFNALLKHWSDYKLIITWDDLRFLRKIGVRI